MLSDQSPIDATLVGKAFMAVPSDVRNPAGWERYTGRLGLEIGPKAEATSQSF
jgi:hypothetical protein